MYISVGSGMTGSTKSWEGRLAHFFFFFSLYISYLGLFAGTHHGKTCIFTFMNGKRSEALVGGYIMAVPNDSIHYDFTLLC